VKNALSNCRVRNPQYGALTSQARKSLLRKKGIHMLFSIMALPAAAREQASRIANYERLEFLGDKVCNVYK
jgi:dsRNA-specific ribonuclease